MEALTDLVLVRSEFVPLSTPEASAGSAGQPATGHMSNAARYTTRDVLDAEQTILGAAKRSSPGQDAPRVGPGRCTAEDAFALCGCTPRTTTSNCVTSPPASSVAAPATTPCRCRSSPKATPSELHPWCLPSAVHRPTPSPPSHHFALHAGRRPEHHPRVADPVATAAAPNRVQPVPPASRPESSIHLPGPATRLTLRNTPPAGLWRTGA